METETGDRDRQLDQERHTQAYTKQEKREEIRDKTQTKKEREKIYLQLKEFPNTKTLKRFDHIRHRARDERGMGEVGEE